MASMDVFQGDGFSMMALTAAINHEPVVPLRLNKMGLFQAQGVDTTVIAIEEEHGSLSIVKTSERGSPAENGTNEQRKLRHFKIPHLAKNATLMADEIQNVRAFGGMSEMEAVLAKLNQRINRRRLEIELTKERLMLGAIKGLVLDANDSEIYNYFTEFGVSAPSDAAFAFSTITQAKADDGIIGKAATAVKREMINALGGMATGNMQICALVGDTFFDKLVHNAETAVAYKNFQAADQLRDRNLAYDSFRYAGITWENYQGDSDGQVSIGANECRFFVKGVPDLFTLNFAPADTFEFVNTDGLPIYVLPDSLNANNSKSWSVEVQSNPLPMCTRPLSLIGGVAS